MLWGAMSDNPTRRFSLPALFDAFLLRPVETKVSAYPRTAHDRVRELNEAANERASVADELLESHALAALPLYREAAVLYMAAVLAVRSEVTLDAPLKTDQVVAQFGQLAHAKSPPGSEQQLRDFMQLLIVADPLLLDPLPDGDAVDRVRGIRPLIGWLHDLVEPRTVREIKIQRMLRVAMVTVLPLALVSSGLYVKLKPVNIALNKPVVASSMHPSSTSQPSGLTDGVTGGTYGVHTNTEASSWVQVDLLDVYRIDKVSMYNRGDGWFDDGLPMTLLFSDNGTDFTEVDKRTTRFGQWLPWTYKAGKKKARYIRVAGAPGRFVALSELEVTGKK